MFSPARPGAADAYRRIGVETSMHTVDQHQIVNLLFEGVLREIVRARGAIQRGDLATKIDAISRALRILEEGLSTSLDRVDGVSWRRTCPPCTTTACASWCWPMRAVTSRCCKRCNRCWSRLPRAGRTSERRPWGKALIRAELPPKSKAQAPAWEAQEPGVDHVSDAD